MNEERRPRRGAISESLAKATTESVNDGALFEVRRTAYGAEITPAPTLASAARDRGVAIVEAASDDQGRAVLDQAIRLHAQSGRPFSANDFRDLLPAERANLLGARILAAAKRGEIVRVGYEPATHAAGHGRPVAVWLAAS